MSTEATLPGVAVADERPGASITISPSDVAPPALSPPAGHPRFPLLDSLRAVAALSVLLAHSMLITSGPQGPHVWWNWFFSTGVQGVTVFFVISGFLLYRPFVNSQLNSAPQARLRDYLRRRVLRIVPAYWLALTLLAIYPGLAGVFTHDWWKFYFLFSGYSYSTVSQGLLVSWSLGIEVTFYLALPLYAMLLSRMTRNLGVRRAVRVQLAMLGLLAAGSILLRGLDHVTGRTAPIQDSLPGSFYWFALGMALAVVSAATQGRARPRLVKLVSRPPAICWAGALAIYVFLAALNGRAHAFTTFQEIGGYYVLGGLLAFLLVAPAVLGDRAGGWPRRVLAWPVLAWLGLVSYGIYLWHVPIITFIVKHWFQGFGVVAVLAIALATCFAAASYYFVERPILRFK